MRRVPLICSVNLSGVVRCSVSRRLLFFFSCHCCSRRRLRVAAAGLLLFLFCTAADRSTTSSSSFSSQAGMSLSYREIIECRYIGLFSISKKYRIEPPISSISLLIYFVFFRRKFQKLSGNLKILRKFRKFSENSENLPKFLKTCRKFLKKKVFSEALISYRIEKKTLISYRVGKKAYRSWVFEIEPGCTVV